MTWKNAATWLWKLKHTKFISLKAEVRALDTVKPTRKDYKSSHRNEETLLLTKKEQRFTSRNMVVLCEVEIGSQVMCAPILSTLNSQF